MPGIFLVLTLYRLRRVSCVCEAFWVVLQSKIGGLELLAELFSSRLALSYRSIWATSAQPRTSLLTFLLHIAFDIIRLFEKMYYSNWNRRMRDMFDSVR